MVESDELLLESPLELPELGEALASPVLDWAPVEEGDSSDNTTRLSPGGEVPIVIRVHNDTADTVRIVTNDFMLTGGDGYTAFAGGTDVLTPGDGLLEVTIEYITANSPVAPAVEGRIVRTP